METEKREDLIIETINTNGMPVKSVYRYVKPEDFTFRQDKIGKKIARKIIPLIKDAQAMNEGNEEKKDTTEIEIDIEKMIPMLSTLDDLEIDEIDIIGLCYVSSKYDKFNEADYELLKKNLQDLPFNRIEGLRGCIPDFFTFFMPRLADGILTSMGQMEAPKETDSETVATE